MNTTQVAQKESRTLRVGTLTRVLRVLYIVFAWIFALCILIQVFLAGMGVFDSPAWFSVHIAFAHGFEYIAVLLLILALVGRFPRAIPLLSLVLIVQFALQYILIEVPGRLGIIFLSAFHPVNAVVMFWVTQHVARRAMAYVTALKKHNQ